MAAADLNMMMNVQTNSSNLRNVNKSIEKGVGPVSITFDTNGTKKARAQIDALAKTQEKAKKEAVGFSEVVTLKGQSFAAYSIASTAIIKLTGAMSNAVREGLKLEAELAKIAQVTNTSVSSIRANTQAVLDISKNYGVASNKIAELIRLLTQTGLSFREATKGAETLARTSLLASFDNLQDTTEGLIALMNSFELSTEQAAHGLEVVNVLAKRFAVESGDIVEAIKRSGGAFKAAGGTLEELASIFTAVRSTSRESAETIATAFRTIFGRLQRPKTIEFFKELNIELADMEGNFIGPKNAIFAISDGLEKLGIRAGSIRFAEVAEQIGGIRQLSKVVPLLTQTAKARRALVVANNAEAESDRDVGKAKQTLSQQLAELTQNFRSLITEAMDSTTFKAIAKLFLTIANTAVSIGRALKPLIPIIATIAGVKISKSVLNAIKFIRGGGASGKDIAADTSGFARGGIVPGSGNGDTVPAMLTPGEFVVRKSAVQAYGAANLGKINKYANGGKVNIGQIKNKSGLQNATLKFSDLNETNTNEGQLDKNSKAVIQGLMFERYIGRRLGQESETGPIDYPNTTKEQIGNKKIFKKGYGTEAFKKSNIKRKTGLEVTLNSRQAKRKKVVNPVVYAFNKGGAVGSDTVPALLTPGEFVVNQKSAKAYGYGNLGEINKYAKGGVVQRFQDGGAVGKPKFRNIEGGFGQLLQEMKQGEKVLDNTFAAFGDWDKALQESEGNLKYNPPGRQDQSLVGIPTDPSFKQSTVDKSIANKRARERQQEFASAKRSTKGSGMDMAALGAFSKQDEQKRVKAGARAGRQARADETIAGIPLFGKLLTKLNKGGDSATDTLSGLATGAKNAAKSLIEVPASAAMTSVAFQGVAEAAKQFGFEMANAPAFQEGANRATAISSYGEIGGSAVKSSGKQILKWGNALKRSEGKLAKFGKPLAKLGATAAKVGPKIAKIANIAGFVQLAGAALEGIFTTDYKKVADQQVELGNVAAAGAAAQKGYTQELNRSIPIIGSWLNLFGVDLTKLLGNEEQSKTVVATKKLNASVIDLKKTEEKLAGEMGREIKEALRTGDLSGVRDVAQRRLEKIDQTRGLATEAFERGKGRRSDFFRGNRKIGTEAIESSTSGIQEATDARTSIFKDLSPLIDKMAANTAAMGQGVDDFNRRIQKGLPEAFKTTGGAIGKATQEKLEKDIEETRTAQKAARKKLEETGHGAEQRALDSAVLANLQAKEAETEAYLENNIAAESYLREQQRLTESTNRANAAMLETMVANHALAEAVFELKEGFRNLDKTASATNLAETGQLNKGSVLQSIKLDVIADGSLADVLKRDGGEEQLRRSASQDSDLYSIVDTQIKGQKALTNMFIPGNENNSVLQGLRGQQGNKQGAQEAANKYIESLFPEGVPAGQEAQIEKLRNSIYQQAFDSDKPIQFENIQQESAQTLEGMGQGSFELIQERANKTAEKILRIQSLEQKKYDKEIQVTKQRIDSQKKAQDTMVALDKERIGSLTAIGLQQKDVLSLEKQNIKAQEKNLQDSIRSRTKAFGTESESKSFKSVRGGEVSFTSDKAKATMKAAEGGTFEDKVIAEQKARNQQKDFEQSDITNSKEIISLQKAKIQGMIKEEQARRENTKAMQEARGALAEDLAFGTDEARASLLEDANVAATALSQGSMAGFTGEQRGQVDKFLGRFTGLGGDIGKQARAAKGKLGAQELLEQGLIRPDQFEQTAQDIARQEEPMNQQVAAGIKEGYATIKAEEIKIFNKELAAINRLAAAAEAFEKAANVEKAQINDTTRKFVTGDKQVREDREMQQRISTAEQNETAIADKQQANNKVIQKGLSLHQEVQDKKKDYLALLKQERENSQQIAELEGRYQRSAKQGRGDTSLQKRADALKEENKGVQRKIGRHHEGDSGYNAAFEAREAYLPTYRAARKKQVELNNAKQAAATETQNLISEDRRRKSAPQGINGAPSESLFVPTEDELQNMIRRAKANEAPRIPQPVDTVPNLITGGREPVRQSTQQSAKVENGGSINVQLTMPPDLMYLLVADSEKKVKQVVAAAMGNASDKLTGSSSMDDVKAALSSSVEIMDGPDNDPTGFTEGN